jgi:hypothetical protein
MNQPLHEHLTKLLEFVKFQCDFCGSLPTSAARDCCDECILKFYLEDGSAPALQDWKMQ